MPKPNNEAIIDDMSERALIGASLVFDTAIADASGIVSYEDFGTSQHKEIWAEIIAQHEAGQRVDVITVAQALPHIGVEYLHKIQNETWAASNISRYASSIVDHRLRRDLIHAAAQITQMAQEGQDASDVADRARDLLQGIETPVGKSAPDPDVDTFIASMPTEYDWLIPDFLEYRDRLLVTAGEGAGKSVLLAQIAVMVAAGIHPWTHADIKPRNVLVVDLENPQRLVSRRYAWMRSKVNRPFDPQRLRIHSRPSGINLTSRTDRRWLIERCNSNAAELLVIGPAYRMSDGVASKADIGGEDHARQVTKALDEIRMRCNVALVMETHAPHSNGPFGRDLRPFGSSVWLRWPEFGIGLRRDAESETKYVMEHWRGARDERAWPKYLNKNAGQWPWTPDGMPNGTFNNTRRTA